MCINYVKWQIMIEASKCQVVTLENIHMPTRPMLTGMDMWADCGAHAM